MPANAGDSGFVTIELEVAGRVVHLSCPIGMESQVYAAAEKLNLDLLEVVGSKSISSSELFEHLFSLTLEYLCKSTEVEDLDQENRISKLTQRLIQAARQAEPSVN